MEVIVVSGHARHGKDTIALMLRDELTKQGYRVVVTHYGDLLKHVCKSFFGWNGEKDEKGRTLLQYVGTDVVREKRPNFWVNFVMDILEMFYDEWDYVLIPDARFVNEVSMPSRYGMACEHIRIVRPGFDNGLTPEQKAHPSECALDHIKPDFRVFNDGTLDDLRLKARQIVKEITANGK